MDHVFDVLHHHDGKRIVALDPLHRAIHAVEVLRFRSRAGRLVDHRVNAGEAPAQTPDLLDRDLVVGIDPDQNIVTIVIEVL